MRVRILFAACTVALLGVVATPSTASAKPKGDAEEKCIKLLEKGQSIDDCQKAPNPILPAGNEIVWGGLAFVVLLLAMWKFALPPVRNMMKQREERIRSDLERAEQARAEAESELAEYRRQLGSARNEAARIIEEARQAADEVRRQVRSQADAEAAELRARAQQDVELARQRATADLNRYVAELSVDLAERIVRRNLDRDAQIALIESYINEVGASGNGQR
jgi:F-type H+-transporting ATPase subunit b